MSTFSGEQITQVNNPDPFAPPIWRSPVFHTPGWIIALVQLWRLLAAIIGFILRHPLLDLAAGVVAVTWLNLGWPGLVLLAVVVPGTLALWWRWRPGSFARFIARSVLGKWRRWPYRRHGAGSCFPNWARSPRPRTPTGSRSAWSPGSPPLTSRTGHRTWRTGSARCSAGSAPGDPARWSGNWSTATPWPPPSRPCRSRST